MNKEKVIFKSLTCPSCGGKFEPIPGETGTYRCKDCINQEAYMFQGEVTFINAFEGFGDDSGYTSPFGRYVQDRPGECTDCGSDCFPQCMDSCGYFND